MKLFRHIIPLLAAIPQLASCQERPEAQLRVQVADENGSPVPGAEVSVSTFHHWQPGEGFGTDVDTQAKYVTDERGELLATMPSLRGDYFFYTQKTGYYETNGPEFRFTDSRKGRWEPWGQLIPIELRRIANPIPLVAKKFGERGDPTYLPAFGEPGGFDLEIGDWAAPHGKGKIKDIVFQLDGRTDNVVAHFDARFRISFSNKMDGIRLHDRDPIRGSALRLPHHAPDSGYHSELVKRNARVPTVNEQTGKVEGQLINDTRQSENYFLRVRSVVDNNGKLIAANYAKVYGPFEWDATGTFRFTYYFNPKPNDRNLEFDPKRNLIGPAPGTREFNEGPWGFRP